MPDLGNPGMIDANNCLPAEGGGYKPYQPLAQLIASSGTLPGIPAGGFVAELEYPASPAYMFYAATSSEVYMATASGGTFTSRSSGVTSTVGPLFKASFAQFDDKIFVARGSGGVLFQTIGSASNFATVSGLTGLRDGRYLFVVGRFLVVANLGSATASSATLEWSAVDDPTNFPTPNSATAIATQSGEQTLNLADGPIVGGYGGDQYAVIVQAGAITRMTYVGPPVVFSFDRIEDAKGQQRRHGSGASGNLVHFQAADGFFKTDGVQIIPIGEGRVNKTFLATAANDIGQGAVTAGAFMECAFDHMNKNIVWLYPVGSTTNSNKMIVYSTTEDRWSSCDQVARTLIEPSPSSASDGLYAFNSLNVLCKFSGTAGSAVFTTGEIEPTEGGRTFVDSLKPLVESSGTAPAITCRIGYRDDLGTTPSYAATTAPFSRTGVANFRVDAKYMRFETQVVGNFKKATGVEFKAKPSGQA